MADQPGGVPATSASAFGGATILPKFDPRALTDAAPIVERAARWERARRITRRGVALLGAVLGATPMLLGGQPLLPTTVVLVVVGAVTGALFLLLLSLPFFALAGVGLRTCVAAACREVDVRGDIVRSATVLLATKRASSAEGALRLAASGRSLRTEA